LHFEFTGTDVEGFYSYNTKLRVSDFFQEIMLHQGN